MEETYYLSNKLVAAKLPEFCVQRRSLVDLFHRETSNPVIFVSAPAGYGKTVSTMLWLKSSRNNIVWIKLDSYDNSLSIFYKQFCAALLSTQPKNKAMEDIFKSPAFSSSPVEHTVSLLSEHVPERKRYALVLDDMHCVTNEEIRKSLIFIWRRLPLSFVTLILTRNVISDEYFSICEGKAAVITEKELAFSEEEIQDYFSKYGRNITAREAAGVHAVTGGWAIGVNALALSGQMELGQNNRQILDGYIKKQIWDHWAEDLRDFMLKTSIVDEMTVALCNRLTACDSSDEILNRLYRTNSFVTHLGGEAYSYNQLFLDFLREKRNESGMDTKALYKITAEYYIDKENYFIARRYAAKSGDWDMFNQVLGKFIRYNLHLNEYVNYSAMLIQHDIPESLCDQHLFVYITHILVCHFRGDASGVQYYLDKLYPLLPQFKQNLSQIQSLLFSVFNVDYRLSFLQLIEQSNVLFSYANLQNLFSWRAAVTMEMPFLHRSSRNFSEPITENVIERCKSKIYASQTETLEVFASGVNCGLLYELNHLKEAMKVAELCRNKANEAVNADLSYALFLHCAAIFYAMGNREQSDDMVRQAENCIEKNNAQYLRPNFLAYKTKLQLMDGDKPTATTWLDNYFVPETEHLELYKIYQHFITARAYMILGQTEKAMKIILLIKRLATDFRRLLDIAEASVLQSSLEWAVGKQKEAQLTLETVLTDMQPYGFIRVIADEGSAILSVLKKVVAKVERECYLGDLALHYVKIVHLATYEQSKRHKGIAVNIRVTPVKLSKQQKLIISLLSKGYKNSEIIKITKLSISTIKCHTAAAYGKLDVNNAMDAVLRARELGIIE